jgi:hypothetical protein
LDDRLKLSPLQWWRDNCSTFPQLAHVARSLLSAQATSVASERAFSSAGIIANKLRSSLSPDSLELCAVVKSALQNGIDLRAELRSLRAKAVESANRTRSASVTAAHAAKKAKAAEGVRGDGAALADAAEAADADAGREDTVDAAIEQRVIQLLAEADDADGE